jgi:hypothetical protein
VASEDQLKPSYLRSVIIFFPFNVQTFYSGLGQAENTKPLASLSVGQVNLSWRPISQKKLFTLSLRILFSLEC